HRSHCLRQPLSRPGASARLPARHRRPSIVQRSARRSPGHHAYLGGRRAVLSATAAPPALGWRLRGPPTLRHPPFDEPAPAPSIPAYSSRTSLPFAASFVGVTGFCRKWVDWVTPPCRTTASSL